MSRIFLYFFGHYAQQEIREMYGRCRSTSVASYPQCFTNVAGGNGGAFAWGILNSFRMKPLSGRPAESRKPWRKSCGITARESGLPPLKTDTSTQTPRTAYEMVEHTAVNRGVLVRVQLGKLEKACKHGGYR